MTIKALYPTVRPTLNLDFAKTKVLDPRITFTRASTGTFVGSNGLIQTAASDAARFDHNPATGESLGLLVEEARTNYRRYSSTFSDGSYIKGYSLGLSTGGSVVLPNQVDSPLGSLTGWKFGPDPAADAGYLISTRLEIWSDYIPSGNTKVLSIFAKAGTAGTTLKLHPANENSDAATFNLETGAVVSGPGSIQNYGNGWYRCSVVTSVNITSGRNFQIHARCSSYSDFIYIAACQFEAGSFPTSYIPTTSATVTRAADVASMTGTNFSSWYRQDEGTMFALHKAQPADLGTQGRPVWQLDRPSSSGGWEHGLIYYRTTINYKVRGGSADGAEPTVSHSDSVGSTTRAVFGWSNALNEIRMAYNGTLSSIVAKGAGTSIDRLNIGNGIALSNYTGQVNTTIARIAYYPVRLPDAQLQALTAT